jgi:Toastrack DUF4097
MKLTTYALLAIGLALVPLAQAEDWSKTFTVSGEPTLRVETSDANIHVDTWDQSTIEARVTADGWKIGDGGLTVNGNQTGNAVEIEVRYPHTVHFGFHSGQYGRVDIEIHMPRRGAVDLHTGDGAIYLDRLQGKMDVLSGDGHQEISSVEGALHAHAGDGDMQVDGKFTALDLSTGDGSIEARAFPGSSIGSGWDLHAGDGSVTLKLPGDFAADVELHTGDGHITLDLPVAVEGRVGPSNISGKLNGGGGELRIHTGDGSIYLKKMDTV